MHPIVAQRERLWLYITAWLIIAGLLCALFIAAGTLRLGESVALLVPMSLLYAFITLSSLYICRALPLQHTPVLTVAGSVLLAAFVSSSAWVLLGKGLSLALESINGLRGIGSSYSAAIPLLFGGGVLLFILAVVVHYLLLAFDAARSHERNALELQVLAREAELKALRAQIQPHFLFNSLNSISALTMSNPAAAREMTLHLAEYFRTTLNLGKHDRITLREEVKLAEQYLSIEQVRFGSRLLFTTAIAPGCGGLMVPALILQPLIENAVNHGIANVVEGGTIELNGIRLPDALVLRITNPYDPGAAQRSSTGMGLENVRRRLKTLYADRAFVSIDRGPSQFTIEVHIPIIQERP